MLLAKVGIWCQSDSEELLKCKIIITEWGNYAVIIASPLSACFYASYVVSCISIQDKGIGYKTGF